MRLRLLLLLLSASVFLQAQYNRSTISGSVSDPTGSPIAGAKVRIAAPKIGLERNAIANESGFFTTTGLPPAEYEVAIQHPGFKAAVRSGITLESDASLNLPFTLAVGDVNEKIEVTAEAPSIDTSTGEVGRLLPGEELRDMALAGRNPYFILGLLPGVAARAGVFLGDFRATSVSMGGLQVNGQLKDTNFLTIDGIPNVRTRDGVNLNTKVSVDFVEEIKILTTHYAPENGRTSGAQINYVTRRGTRDYHFTLYDFLMHDKLQARRFLTGDKTSLRYNNYGWTLGGPVYLPKKWNSDRSKLFFFAGQEYRRLGGFNQKFATVPTDLERNLNFSQSAVKPVDPTTGQPFPGNIIPQARVGEFGRAVLKVFPAANFPGPGGNYTSSRKQPTDAIDTMIRVDYNLKPNWQLSARWLYGQQQFTSPYDGSGNNIPLFDTLEDTTGRNGVVSLTTTLNPTTVNEVSFGYADSRANLVVQGEGAFRATYGFNFTEFFPGNRLDRIPTVNVSGYTSFNGSPAPTFANSPQFVIRDNFSKTISNHTIKAGFYFESMNLNELVRTNDNGLFTFGASAQNPLSSRSPLANSFLGIFDSYQEDTLPVQVPYQARIFEVYAQDSWRIRRNLSIEFGLRWALLPPWHSQWNNVSAFMASAWDPAKAPQVAANGSIVPNTGDPFNGIVIPGSAFPAEAQGRVPQASDPAYKSLLHGKPDGFVDTRYTNFQPRVSFAWDPTGSGKTAIRGGSGIFHGVNSVRSSGMLLGGLPPFTQQASITNGRADTPASGALATTQFPINIQALPDKYKIPTIYSYSLSIQRQLPWNTVFDIGYVGNTSRHMLYNLPLNFLSPATQAANQGVDLRRLFPFRGLGTLTRVEPGASQSYNSMQLAVNRRLSQGMSLGVAYTLAKNTGYGYQGIAALPQDPLNYRAEHSEIEESRRHNMVIRYTYELPFFRAQRGFVGKTLGGWELSGAWLLSSGRRYDTTVTSATGQIATRPDVLRNPNLPVGERTLFRWFDTEAFARPANYTYGNAGREILVGPGVTNWDAFILKNIAITERLRLQYRAEFFNMLNHPNYNSVNTQFGGRAFGQVDGASGSRSAEMGLKLNW